MADDGITFRMELDSAEAEAALDRLRETAEGLKGALEKVGQALESSGFSALEKTALAAAAAIGAVTTGLFELAKASSESIRGVGDLADQLGSTVEQMSSMKSAMVELGAAPETMQLAFNKMGNAIQKIFPEISKSIQNAASDAEKASLNLIEAEAKLSAARSFGKVPEALQHELEVKRDLLAVEEARNAAAEVSANSIQTLTQYVNALASGASVSGIKINATVDNIIKGLIASVGPSVTQLQGLGSSFSEISQKAPEAGAVMLKLADVFHNLHDTALKTAIATQLFGKQAASDMVTFLSQGSAAIKEADEKMKALGLTFSDADRDISVKFSEGMRRLGNVIGIVAGQLGLLFQPAITAAMNDLADAIGKNRTTILAWGQAVASTVIPILQSFVRVLSGAPEAGKDDWLVKLIQRFKQFGQAALLAINIVRIALTGLLTLADGFAAQINKMFGTAFSGMEVLIVAFFGRMALAAVTAIRAILVGLGPVGIAILALSLAIGLLIEYWPQISAAANNAWQSIKNGANTVSQFISAWVTTPIGNAWQWIADTFNNAVAWVSTKIDETKALIEAWVTTPIGNAWQWIVEKWNAMLAALGLGGGGGGATDSSGEPQSAASGGLIGGRGTGTSDSNLAWVSRGEHIMPARAVSQPGVLAFLEALRRSGGNLSRVLDGMGRFAAGGLVTMPALGGGGTGAMSHAVTIQFPGLPVISGLRASSDVVGELQRAAAMAQVRSGGRKPSRYT
jgi:hypothetical protein